VERFLAENSRAMGVAEEAARRLRSASLQYGGPVPATEAPLPEITDEESQLSVLRNTQFALGHEIGGQEWEGVKRDGVGHDRASTLMAAANLACSKLDTSVLPQVQAIESKGEEVRNQLHSLEETEKQADIAVDKLHQHTIAMELEKRRKHAERIDLEKNIVEWHLAQSEESEAQTRRWLQGALNKAEQVIETQGGEIQRMIKQHAQDKQDLQDEVDALKEQILSTNRTNKTMQEEMALNWRNLREELSDSKFEREKLEAREYKATSELRLTQEDLEATQRRLETAREEIATLQDQKAAAQDDAIKARRELEERLEYSNELRMERCEAVQSDRMEAEARLRMELQSTQIGSHRLQQEKVEVSARLALADNESATVMRELVAEQQANGELRANMETMCARLKAEEDESARLRRELSVAGDDVLNLQHELNTVLKVQSTLRKENRELGHLTVQAVDYRQYQSGNFKLSNVSSEDAWSTKNDALTTE